MRLSGKVALVTGGASGIGRAVLSQLLSHGAKVSFCDVDRAGGEETERQLGAQHDRSLLFLHCDVSDQHRLEECFKQTKEKLGGLDIVVNNAGIGNEREEAWRKMVDVNLKGAVTGTYLGMKYMAGRGGVVVNVGSTTALQPFPSTPVYSATKAALIQFTRSIGSELYMRRSGVRVICLNPGYTLTSLPTEDPSKYFPDQETLNHFIAALSTLHPQSVDHVGQALLEILDKAENGTVWSVESGLPPTLSIIN